MNSLIISHWAFLCRKSAVDKDGNYLMAGEIIEDINFQAPKELVDQVYSDLRNNKQVVLPIEMELLALIEFDGPSKKEKINIDITFPDGQRQSLGSAEVTSGANNRVRNRTRFNAIPISGEGRHTLSISINDGAPKEIARVPFFVSISRNDVMK